MPRSTRKESHAWLTHRPLQARDSLGNQALVTTVTKETCVAFNLKPGVTTITPSFTSTHYKLTNPLSPYSNFNSYQFKPFQTFHLFHFYSTPINIILTT